MAFILPIEEPWTSQPQEEVGIDWSNPITKGVTAAIIGNNAEILTRSTRATFGTAPASAAGSNGRCWDSSAASGGQYYSVSDNRWTTSAQSHFMLAEITSSSGVYAGLIGSAKGDGTSGSLAIQRSGSGTSYAVFNAPTATASFGDVTDIVNAGVKAICVTCEGTNSAAYLNGIYWGGGSLSGGVTTQSSGRLFSLCARDASTTYYHGGRVFVRFAWNRALSAQEVASLSANPWQIFTP